MLCAWDTHTGAHSAPFLLLLFGPALGGLLIAAFGVAVKLFAVLPAPFATWQVHVEDVRRHDPNTRRDSYGNPIDD